MEPITVLIIALIILAGLMALGIAEKQRNEKNIKSIPIRINVNGIRGKSTATRLITAILNEAGYKTLGKTTGTASRMIYWDREEEPIPRKPRGVSISEQIKVINEAAKLGAEALVCECMAVNPEYQKVYQHQMIHATMTVIVNVLEDHLDEMGPNKEMIAWAFAETIPYNGLAVLPDCEFTELFIKTANERHTKYRIIDDDEIHQDYLDQFEYKLFDHNVAVALAAARLMNIPDEVSLRGMLKAAPDPGALRIHSIRNGATFVNGFAANEPSSSLDIWEVVQNDLGEEVCRNPLVIMNCRPDRVDRTRQFIKDFFPKIPNMSLLVIGERTEDVKKAYEQGKFPNCIEFQCIEGKDMKPIKEYLEPKIYHNLLFGVGNIHGIGEEFLEYIIGSENDDTTKKPENTVRKEDKERA